MTLNDLKKLKSKLPKNGVKIICERTGYSKTYVNYVLNGKRSQKLIIDTAIEIAIQFKTEESMKKELIKKL